MLAQRSRWGTTAAASELVGRSLPGARDLAPGENSRYVALRMRHRIGLVWFGRWKHRLKTSLWLEPLGAMLLGIGLALGLPYLDGFIQRRSAWFLFEGKADSARELLGTIASALLTITGLVFSITILVLQLASSQFSPRVLQTFLQDRSTKLSMGVFVGNFVYALVLLPQVRSESMDHEEFVPAFSVAFALGLTLVSVAVLIRYIHHMAQSIRAVHVIERVARDTRRCMDRMYPGTGALDCERSPRADVERVPDRVVCNSRGPGVVLTVDEERLLQFASERDLVIALVPRTGGFVPAGSDLLRIFGRADLADADRRRLEECIVLGSERTLQQDTAFGFRQLVDIAERALSPGINDPSTAVQVLDHIHDLLRQLAPRPIPGPAAHDDQQRLRLWLPRLDWNGYVELSCQEIARYGANSIQVTRRLHAMLQDLLSLAPAARTQVLQAQLRQLPELTDLIS
jgi:uncharacterized membrane protein